MPHTSTFGAHATRPHPCNGRVTSRSVRARAPAHGRMGRSRGSGRCRLWGGRPACGQRIERRFDLVAWFPLHRVRVLSVQRPSGTRPHARHSPVVGVHVDRPERGRGMENQVAPALPAVVLRRLAHRRLTPRCRGQMTAAATSRTIPATIMPTPMIRSMFLPSLRRGPGRRRGGRVGWFSRWFGRSPIRVQRR